MSVRLIVPVLFLLVVLGAAWRLLGGVWPLVGSRRARWAAGVPLAVLIVLPWLVSPAWCQTHGRVGQLLELLRLAGASVLVASVLVVAVLGPAALWRRWSVGRGVAALQAASEAGTLVVEPLPVDEDSASATGRRAFLGQALGVVPAAALATGGAGVAAGTGTLVLRRVEVPVQGLPAALDGFRIGQLSDVHVGPFVSPSDLRTAIDLLDGAGVDLQVLTGDLIDDLTQLDDTLEALGGVRARHGMLAILGNHEHYRGAPRVRAAYAALAARGAPVRLLVDETCVLHHEGAELHVAGLDDPGLLRGGREAFFARHARDVLGPWRQLNPEGTLLCLAHHPHFFDHTREHGAHLTLSGHTHGGQVGVGGVPLFGSFFRYILGRYGDRSGQLYVSGGTGHWLPWRVGIPAEVTVLTLRRAV